MPDERIAMHKIDEQNIFRDTAAVRIMQGLVTEADARMDTEALTDRLQDLADLAYRAAEALLRVQPRFHDDPADVVQDEGENGKETFKPWLLDDHGNGPGRAPSPTIV